MICAIRTWLSAYWWEFYAVSLFYLHKHLPEFTFQFLVHGHRLRCLFQHLLLKYHEFLYLFIFCLGQFSKSRCFHGPVSNNFPDFRVLELIYHGFLPFFLRKHGILFPCIFLHQLSSIPFNLILIFPRLLLECLIIVHSWL